MKVRLGNVLPNPYRNIESYPIRKEKVEALKQSIDSTDWWANVVARRAPGKNGCIEIAYGHHRLAALRELYEPSDEFDFIVRELSEDDMLRIMANENQEEWGSSFWVTLETVRALVEAHAQSSIHDLQVEYRGGHGRIAVADLLPEHSGRDAPEMWVSPKAVATYFGWLQPDGSAHNKVSTALSALRLIAAGHATVEQFRDIGNKQAEAVVREAAIAERRWKQDIKEQEHRIKLAKKAEQEAKDRKQREAAAKVRNAAEKLRAHAEERMKTEPKKAAKAASAALARGEGYHAAAKAARSQVTAGYDPFAMPPDINKVAASMAAKTDRICRSKADTSTYTDRITQIVNNSEHLEPEVREDLVRALRAASARFAILADRAEQPGKRTTKTELEKLGVA